MNIATGGGRITVIAPRSSSEPGLGAKAAGGMLGDFGGAGIDT
jgi:hypothetical protein